MSSCTEWLHRIALVVVAFIVLILLGILASLGLTDEAWDLWSDLRGMDLSTYFVALLIGSLSSFPVLFFGKSKLEEGQQGAPKAPREAPPAPAAPAASAPSGGSGGSGGVPKPTRPTRPPAKVPKPKPLSPRSQARQLVGTRMSEEQAAKAVDKILALRSYVDRVEPIDLDEMWGFFDLDPPASRRSMDPTDPLLQRLKGKLNRQRLLFHPDKNGHPEAEKTFKFLEVCHRKLMTSYTRQTESVHQRTRREEEELKQEEARRQKQEEERRAQMELLEREEEEKIRRVELQKQRLDQMLEAKRSAFEAKHNQSQMVSRDAPIVSLFTSCGSSKSILGKKEDAEETSVIGRLSVRLRARDLPAPELLFAGHHYAVLSVGDQTFETKRVPGQNCQWDANYDFPIHRVDTSLAVSVFREGWFQDSLLGKTEIPFLDIEEWSGHWMGRLLESENTESLSVVELQASFDWF